MQRLHGIGVLSCGKFAALFYALIGVLYGGLYAVFIFVFGAAAAMEGGEEAALMLGGGVVGALLALVGFPIVMAVFGFIAGLIGALAFNLAARLTGGLELDIR